MDSWISAFNLRKGIEAMQYKNIRARGLGPNQENDDKWEADKLREMDVMRDVVSLHLVLELTG